jgi:hypothetical protein
MAERFATGGGLEICCFPWCTSALFCLYTRDHVLRLDISLFCVLDNRFSYTTVSILGGHGV